MYEVGWSWSIFNAVLNALDCWFIDACGFESRNCDSSTSKFIINVWTCIADFNDCDCDVESEFVIVARVFYFELQIVDACFGSRIAEYVNVQLTLIVCE